MKKKYTLTIAEVPLNVTVDESPETVEYIVGVIDRKMREILLRSRYCPKTQAALLCALDLCAEKIKAKEEIESLQDELASLEEAIKAAEEKQRRADAFTAALEQEKARLEDENAKLREALKEAGYMTFEEEAAPAPEDKKDDSDDDAPKKPQKNRVGAMFDLLTFSDM